MWRLHSPARRRGDAFVHYTGWARRGKTDRDELFESPNYRFDFARRDFLKTFGLGLVFIVPAARILAQQRGQGESGRGGFNERLPNDIDAWIHINEDGGVTAFTGKVEVGQ